MFLSLEPLAWSMFSSFKFKFQVLFVTYTTIQRLYNQQWNESRVRSMDSANIEKTTQGK